MKLESIASPDSAQSVVRSLPALAQRLGLTVDVEINGVAMFVVPGDTPDDADARWKSRGKKPPEPLPTPAPRVSRVIELADDYMAGTRDRVRAVGIAVLAVEETLDAVRRKAVDAGWSNDQLDALDLVRGGACAAMLEPR